MTKRKSIDRREFVTTTTGAALAAALGPTIRIKRPQKTLKILQWSHFVPSYDVWVDTYAKDWCTTYNALTRKGLGDSHDSGPDPGDYSKSVCTELGMPDGPATWEDLAKAAPRIKGKPPESQIPIGIGMSQELDSNMAARGMLWS